MVTCKQVTNTFHGHKLKLDLLGISTQNIYNQTSDELFKIIIVGEYSIGIFSHACTLLLNSLGTCYHICYCCKYLLITHEQHTFQN